MNTVIRSRSRELVIGPEHARTIASDGWSSPHTIVEIVNDENIQNMHVQAIEHCIKSRIVFGYVRVGIHRFKGGERVQINIKLRSAVLASGGSEPVRLRNCDRKSQGQ